MKKMKPLAALMLVLCLWVTMLPMPLVTAAEKDATLTGIEIGELPQKTEYLVGEALDTTGLILVASYSDGSTKEITEGITVSGFDSQKTGPQTITVTYQGKTTEFTVTVYALEITGIAISDLPRKTKYWIGETLDVDGLTLNVFYSDGSVAEISKGFQVTGFDSNIVGEQTLTVSYMDKSATFSVTVEKSEVIRLDIISQPKKTEYWIGEALDTDGLILLASYTDGKTAEVTEGFLVSGFDSATAGKQTLTATYMGASATFSVIVNKLEVLGIEVISLPVKTEYWTGEALDTAGLTIRATYYDGSTKEIMEGFSVTGFDCDIPGKQTLTVMYGEAAAEFTVTVQLLSAENIEIISYPVKTQYWIGEELDTTGLILKVSYSNGTQKEITEGFTVSGFSSAAAGEKNVLVYYGELFDVFTVTVKKPTVTKVSIETQPNKTEYWIGEPLDLTGLALKITCSDGSTAIVNSGFTYRGFSSTSAGKKQVIITYSTKMVFLSVTVKEVVLSGVSVKTQPEKTEYRVGEMLDTTGLTLIAIYSDGKTEELTEGFTVSGFDSTITGAQTVTVTYEEFTAEFVVTVICEHREAENGQCKACKATVVAVTTDEKGNLIGNFVSIEDAFAAAIAGNTVLLQTDCIGKDLILPVGAALDLNGYTLMADSLLTYGSSQITDSSPENKGMVKFTDPDGNMISQFNKQLPVFDNRAGGYRFFSVTVTPKTVTGNSKYWFRVDVENFQEFYSLVQSGAQVQIIAKMTWNGQEKDTYAVADVAFTQSWASCYRDNREMYITVSVEEKNGVENFVLIPGITSGGVEIFGAEM